MRRLIDHVVYRAGIGLIVLCFLGFISTAPYVARAYQAQSISRQAERDENVKERALNTERIQELDKKLVEIKQQKLEERLTRLEAIQETNHTLLIGVAASIAILLLETGMRLIASLAGRRKV